MRKNIEKGAIVFDMDGTLVNSLPDICYSLNHVLRKNGLPTHEENEYPKWIGNGITDLIANALPTDKSSDDEYVERIIKEFRSYYREHWLDYSHLYPGIEELLDFLTEKRISLSILSNKPDAYTKEIASQILKNWKFDIIQGALTGIPSKPAPDLLIKIIADLNLGKKEVLYVGDTETDIKTAKSAGVDIVAAGWGYREKDYLYQYKPLSIINYPAEVLYYI